MRHPDPSARSFPRVTYMMEALLSRPNDLCDPDVVDVGFDPLSSRDEYSIRLQPAIMVSGTARLRSGRHRERSDRLRTTA